MVADFPGTFRVQAVGLHQNVSNTGGFKQHAAIGYNNKYLFHVMKSNLFTE